MTRVIVSLSGNKISEARDFTAKDVVEYLGVPPQQVIEYKGLVGDTSDNIPGVRGVGEKTAIDLLAKYPTLEDIYAHIDELKPAVKAKMEAGQEFAFLSRDLATIRTDLKMTLELAEARTDHINYPAVEALFRELEFNTLIVHLQKLAKNMQGGGGETGPAAPPSGGQLSLFGEEVKRIGEAPAYQLTTVVVDTPEILHHLCQKLAAAEWIGLDTETTSTKPMQADLVGISLAVQEGEGFYIPVGHRTGKQLPLEQVIAALRPLLEDPKNPSWGTTLISTPWC